MAYKKIVTLDADTTISLGGTNTKTGKPNPTSIEGYYLGNKQVDSDKSATGKCYIHYFQTSKGNVAVWGKANLDRKLADAVTGQMTLVEFTGMQKLKKGTMYVFSVAQDSDNSIEVTSTSSGTNPPDLDESEEVDTYGNSSTDEDGGASYEQEETRQTAALNAAERKAKVQALLSKGSKTK